MEHRQRKPLRVRRERRRTKRLGLPRHNATLPFTRNVVGPMDYTPVTFNNSQHPHVTSYGHKLALGVLFESGLQHLADRPSGYYDRPAVVQRFLSQLPAAWDDTKLIDGYPGRDIVLARRKGDVWYLGGINGEARTKSVTLDFGFLPPRQSFKLTLMADGEPDQAFAISHHAIQNNSKINVNLLRNGGFAALIEPLD